MRSLRAETVTALLARLHDVASSDPAAAQLGRSLLAPLAREDLERGNNLLDTLRTYYTCDARVDRTADKLFLHRNSVRYRLDRVRSLLGLDIDQPHVITALSIALASTSAVDEEHADAG
jgi:DNA-binding PucR family transcriptional regulator